MINRLYPFVLLIASVLALGSCVKEERQDPAPEPTRVLLVYVGTDNNLSGYEQAKIQGLRDGLSGRETDHIIVYRDTRGAGARLMEISGLASGEAPREIAAYGTENSACSSVLSRVIGDVCSFYPADSYGLLVFSHASGWLPSGVYNEFAAGGVPASALNTIDAVTGNPTSLGGIGAPEARSGSFTSRSVIIDGGEEMDLAAFASAVPDGVFDYIAFEACFMAGVEVAYALRNKADYILASSAEIVHPGFAPVYGSSTGKLLGGNLSGFGQDAFDLVMTYAEGDSRSATYSVIATDPLKDLLSFVRDRCDMSRALMDPAAVADIQHFDRLTGTRLFFDFGDYYSRLCADSDRAELMRLVGRCVTWKANTKTFMLNLNGFVVGSHSGLTCYIPQSRFPGLNAAYAATDWASAVSAGIQVNPWIDRTIDVILK